MAAQSKQKPEVQRIFACFVCDMEYKHAATTRNHMRDIGENSNHSFFFLTRINQSLIERINTSDVSGGKRRQEYV
jgi:hypothetical protein